MNEEEFLDFNDEEDFDLDDEEMEMAKKEEEKQTEKEKKQVQEMPKIIGRNIKGIRETKKFNKITNYGNYDGKKNYTQKELANKTGISLSTIKRIESGDFHKIDLKDLYQLSKALQTNFYTLFKSTILTLNYPITDVNEKLQIINEKDRDCIIKLIDYMYLKTKTDNESNLKNMRKISTEEKLNWVKRILEL